MFDRDDLITTASIYWLNGSIASSLRLYFEHYANGWAPVHNRLPAIEAPTAFAVFPNDLVHLPRSVAAEHTNLHRWTVTTRVCRRVGGRRRCGPVLRQALPPR